MPNFYSYDPSDKTLYMNESLFKILLAVLTMGAVFALLIGLIFYVFQSVGLHRIARRRGIRHAWLAWLPLGNAWIMGSISDQYQYVVKGWIRNRRVLLVLLSVAVTALSVLGAVLSVNVVMAAVGQELFGVGRIDPAQLIAVMSVTAVEGIVALICLVFHYFALYDLYISCSARYGVLYLVLSVVFNFLEPFFLFACRDKDEGMPPRREQPVIREEPAFSVPEQVKPEE